MSSRVQGTALEAYADGGNDAILAVNHASAGEELISGMNAAIYGRSGGVPPDLGGGNGQDVFQVHSKGDVYYSGGLTGSLTESPVE